MKKPRLFGGLLVLVLGSLTLYLTAISQSADYELTFQREAQSTVSPQILGQSILRTINWPSWHYNMADAKMVDTQGNEYPIKEQILQPGAILQLKMEPPTKQWKRFELQIKVLEFVPDRLLRIRVFHDSSGKITRQFDGLEWTVELRPNGTGTLIVGSARAATRTSRARIFGRLAPRIVMNQLFYPDLASLAKLEHPQDLNPIPPHQR